MQKKKKSINTLDFDIRKFQPFSNSNIQVNTYKLNYHHKEEWPNSRNCYSAYQYTVFKKQISCVS